MDASHQAGPVTGVGSIDVVDLHHRYGTEDVLVGVDVAIEAGTTLALLGPSGCGKTTLLRAIAGLERPWAGTVSIDGETMAGPSIWVPPEKRRVGLVFQDWALFPHRTVAGNVGYGLPRADRATRVAAALDLVGLDGFGDRMPATLSGGQQQRVALARTLAPQPRVLLLDEPFSNLDASRRVDVRAELRALLAEIGTTAVFVTHDQEEAFVLGDRVALMHNGRIVQVDTPQGLYRHPADRWAAEFVGDAVVLAGQASGSSATTPIGALPLERAMDGPVEVVIRPEQLRLREPDPRANGGSATDPASTKGLVEAVEYYGHDAMVHVLVGDQSIKVRTGPVPVGSPGRPVEVSFVGQAAIAFDRQT